MDNSCKVDVDKMSRCHLQKCPTFAEFAEHKKDEDEIGVRVAIKNKKRGFQVIFPYGIDDTMQVYYDGVYLGQMFYDFGRKEIYFNFPETMRIDREK